MGYLRVEIRLGKVFPLLIMSPTRNDERRHLIKRLLAPYLSSENKINTNSKAIIEDPKDPAQQKLQEGKRIGEKISKAKPRNTRIYFRF